MRSDDVIITTTIIWRGGAIFVAVRNVHTKELSVSGAFPMHSTTVQESATIVFGSKKSGSSSYLPSSSAKLPGPYCRLMCAVVVATSCVAFSLFCMYFLF